MKKKRKIIIGILILIVLVIALFFTFFYAPKCKDISCWKSKVSDCNKAKYLNDDGDIFWEYEIKGKNKGNCMIEVKAVSVTEGLIESKAIEGHTMTCTQPSGASIYPETNPNFCHGRLKEELQVLVINQLHKYVLENVEDIGDELAGIGVGNSS